MDASKITQPLFLFDDDDDVEFVVADLPRDASSQDQPADAPEVASKPAVPTTDAFDLEAYQRESLARHRREYDKNNKSVLISESIPKTTAAKDAGDKSGDGKPRQKPTRLDDGTLLSSNGFPQLMKATQEFTIKGKGHEATDLDRLLQIYRFWTHQLHPKMQFRDTVLRIEKLCHSRRMLSALSVWRDEAHGIPDENDQPFEEEQVADQNMEDQTQENMLPTDVPHPTPPSSRAASHPPTSDMESEPNHVIDDVSDADMDALIQEYANKPQDEDMWQDPSAFEEYFAVSAPPPPNPKRGNGETTVTSSSHEEVEDWGEDMYI
ncbi:hypothetical protein APHAL10511_001132 [Amanita phalloides]|nr:hypothetical protein APHAL10511_001132 [Amanita phalloides]